MALAQPADVTHLAEWIGIATEWTIVPKALVLEPASVRPSAERLDC
jgi:hypothetical protein